MEAPIALVTGANRGIGLATARGLLRRGCRLFAGARRPESMQAVEGAEVVALDVTDPGSVRAACDQIRRVAGRLDILVNNAGILLEGDDSILHVDLGLLRRTLETNTVAVLGMIQAFAPLMPSGGRIVNVSSTGGQLHSPSTWSPAYCISKTALNAVTVQAAEALKSRGISVNALCPGWVRTDMGGAGAPLGVEEGALGILWLALDAPRNLTGGFIQDRERIPW